MAYFVYILYSKSADRYYIGSTKDLDDRLKRHNTGRSKYTKRGIPWDLTYKEEYPTRSDALKRERELKNWKSRIQIERLVRTSPDT